MTQHHSRHIHFEGVLNFRDLGGYKARGGRTVAWRRVFRSGELHRMSGRDNARLKEEIGLKAAIDLRTPGQEQKQRETALLNNAGARYLNLPFRQDHSLAFKQEIELYQRLSNMGEIYLYQVQQKTLGQRVVDALEIISGLENHPVLFHCAVGKDRTGILASILLSALGVADEDVIRDYVLTAPFMEGIRNRAMNDPLTPEDVKMLPAFAWEAAPESMALFLDALKKEYGSTEGYLKENGADFSLVRRLETALLV